MRPTAGPVVSILDGEKITIDGLVVADGADPVIYVDGPKANGIILKNTSTVNAKSVIRFSATASNTSVTVK